MQYCCVHKIRIIDIARKEKGGHGNLFGELESPPKSRAPGYRHANCLHLVILCDVNR